MPAATALDNNQLRVGWDDYHRAIELLALKVHESDWKFDQIICLARGGLRVGDILSRIFGLPLAILSVSSYREGHGTVRGTLDIAASVSMIGDALQGRVLLVDDLVDSGVTFKGVIQYLKEAHPAITELRSAVIWAKGSSVILPDYFLHFLAENPWISQPFEIYDTMRPEQLPRD